MLPASAGSGSLNPSNALAYVALGVSLSLAGRSREGIPQLERSIDLSPQDPWLYQYMTLLAQACLNAHEYKMAETWARKAVVLRHDYTNAHFFLAISLGYLERDEDARAELNECERLNPDFVRRRLSEDMLPCTEIILDGLRKAGWKV